MNSIKAWVIWCAVVGWLAGAGATAPATLTPPAQPAAGLPARTASQDSTPGAPPALHATDPAPEPERRFAAPGAAAAASAARARADDDLRQPPRPGLLLLAGLAALLFMAARHSS